MHCLQFARKRGEMSKLATVKRAELSAKAELSRGGDFVPLEWMQTPLSFENQAAGKAASMGAQHLLSTMHAAAHAIRLMRAQTLALVHIGA